MMPKNQGDWVYAVVVAVGVERVSAVVRKFAVVKPVIVAVAVHGIGDVRRCDAVLINSIAADLIAVEGKAITFRNPEGLEAVASGVAPKPGPPAPDDGAP